METFDQLDPLLVEGLLDDPEISDSLKDMSDVIGKNQLDSILFSPVQDQNIKSLLSDSMEMDGPNTAFLDDLIDSDEEIQAILNNMNNNKVDAYMDDDNAGEKDGNEDDKNDDKESDDSVSTSASEHSTTNLVLPTKERTAKTVAKNVIEREELAVIKKIEAGPSEAELRKRRITEMLVFSF